MEVKIFLLKTFLAEEMREKLQDTDMEATYKRSTSYASFLIKWDKQMPAKTGLERLHQEMQGLPF